MAQLREVQYHASGDVTLLGKINERTTRITGFRPVA